MTDHWRALLENSSLFGPFVLQVGGNTKVNWGTVLQTILASLIIGVIATAGTVYVTVQVMEERFKSHDEKINELRRTIDQLHPRR